jgi:hypothetical protein
MPSSLDVSTDRYSFDSSLNSDFSDLFSIFDYFKNRAKRKAAEKEFYDHYDDFIE